MRIRNFILTVFLLCGIQASLAESMPTDSIAVISGTVTDGNSRRKLAGTTLTVPGSNIATVTNADGYFSFKIPYRLLGKGIKAERIGYASALVSGTKLNGIDKNISIRLRPLAKILNEVMVYGADPRELIESALLKIPQNYSSTQNMFSAFYRETVQKGKRYIGVSEAIANVLKKPYRNCYIAGDRVQVTKGRRLMSQRNSDTIAVKIVGGPTMPIGLDIVKNEDYLFSIPELDNYEFKTERMSSIDGRNQIVVSFKPKVKLPYALHKGIVFIDVDNLAISRTEFSLDMSDKSKATRAILYKKPAGLRFNPQEMSFVVTYKYQNGISYLNYISAKTRFKCDWKRHLFSSGYTVLAEMVMVDREDNSDYSISRKDAFGARDIFYDMVDSFGYKEFWKDYNIIEPTESLEKAVIRLKNSQQVIMTSNFD